MKPHKTDTIPLKLIEVDRRIRPLVDWINSLPGVFTTSSCEGQDEWYKDENDSWISDMPYIAFVYTNEECAQPIYDMIKDLPISKIDRAHEITLFTESCRDMQALINKLPNASK